MALRENYMTASELSAYAGVSKQQVNIDIRLGNVKADIVGNIYLIKKTDAAEYREQKKLSKRTKS